MWLKCLLAHHYRVLMPHMYVCCGAVEGSSLSTCCRFVLLSNVVEVVPVEEAVTLLPSVDAKATVKFAGISEKTWRLQPDWVELERDSVPVWENSSLAYENDPALSALEDWMLVLSPSPKEHAVT